MQDHPLYATGKRSATSKFIQLQRSGVMSASKSAKLALCLIMLLLTCFSFSGPVQPVRGAQTRYVPAEYPTIQKAVNASSNGDTVQVSPGLYYEHVVVPDTLNQLQIIGNPANPATTIVDGTSSGTVFRLGDANKVTVQGFTVRNAGNGNIAISSLKDFSTNDYHIIRDNIIENGQYGIYLSYSRSNTITNNSIIHNSIVGIHVEFSADNIISQNTIQQSVYGIRMLTVTGSNINNNKISETSTSIDLELASTGNTLSFNQVSGQNAGIFISSDSNTAHHNVVTNSDRGIWVYNSMYAQIYYNNITQCSRGIRIEWATATLSYHNIHNNKVSKDNYGWGIEAVNSYNNTFTGNWLQENAWGISLSSSAYNTVYHNNFINNSVQATTNAENIWAKNGQGNHWSDHTSPDANGDGIVDTSYWITPGRDNYPLVRSWSEHDIAVVSISTSAALVAPGTVVDITVEVRNNANISVSESFTVTAKYNSTNIETKSVTSLAQGAIQILTFNWNTEGVAAGHYTISVVASTVPDELNTGNNNHSDGTVAVTFLGDADHDGDVDYDDFIVLAGAYGSSVGQPAYNPDADLDHDGDVDYDDFIILAGEYGKRL